MIVKVLHQHCRRGSRLLMLLFTKETRSEILENILPNIATFCSHIYDNITKDGGGSNSHHSLLKSEGEIVTTTIHESLTY